MFKRLLGWLRENRRFLLLILLMFAARSSLADHYVVPSGSMENTLFPGDRVVVDKRAYGLRVPFTDIELADGASPARGDIVIFDAPDSGVRLVKRVVAIGGDIVQVSDGQALVNGKPLDYSGLNVRFGGGPDVPPTRVPEGFVFVLGDARGNSRDSRWFGFVPDSSLYAKALRVYYRSDRGLVWLPL